MSPIIIKENNLYGAVNLAGEIIIEPQYKFIDEFNAEGYARVGIQDGYQIIDTKGNAVDHRIYNALAYLPEQNLFVGEAVGKCCLIQLDGTILVDTENDYDRIYPPSNGLCKVVKNKKYGYIDEDGKVVVPLKYDAADAFADNGLAYVTYPSGKGGYIDQEGLVTIGPGFDSGSSFKFGLAAVSENGEYIYINKNGQKVFNATFKYASGFAACGLAKTVSFDDRHGLVRPDSSIPISLKKGCELSEFVGNSQVTKFRVNGKEALINNEGKIITGLNYDDIRLASDSGWHPFVRNGWWGYLDNDGNHATPIIYRKTSELTENNAALIGAYYPADETLGDLYIIGDRPARVTKEVKQVIQKQYAKVGAFEQGLAFAVKKNQPVVLNSRGKEISGHDVGKNSDVADYEIESYEVLMQLEGKWTSEQTSQLLQQYFESEEILEVKGPHATFLYNMPVGDNDGELEIFMYYFLDGNELGTYEYRQID